MTREVILVTTFGNGPDNLFPITELQIITRKNKLIFYDFKVFQKKQSGFRSYKSVKFKVAHAVGIEPLKQFLLRSLPTTDQNSNNF